MCLDVTCLTCPYVVIIIQVYIRVLFIFNSCVGCVLKLLMHLCLQWSSLRYPAVGIDYSVAHDLQMRYSGLGFWVQKRSLWLGVLLGMVGCPNTPCYFDVLFGSMWLIGKLCYMSVVCVNVREWYLGALYVEIIGCHMHFYVNLRGLDFVMVTMALHVTR